MILLRAIDKHLLAQWNKLLGCDLPSTLKRAGRRKRPARSTLTLVLHWCNGPLCDPIHRIRKWGTIILMGAKVLQAAPEFLWPLVAEVCLGKLIRRLIGELVDAKLILVVLSVFNLNEVICGLEVLEPLGGLRIVFIVLRVRVHKFLPCLGVLIVGHCPRPKKSPKLRRSRA